MRSGASGRALAGATLLSLLFLISGCTDAVAPSERDGGIPLRDAARESSSPPRRDAGGGPLTSLVTGMRFVELSASDAVATFQWYRDVVELPSPGSSSFEFADRSGLAIVSGGVVQSGAKSAAEQSVVVSMLVPDLDVAMTTLEARGVRFAGDIGRTPEPARWRAFADLEGNRIQILEHGEPQGGLAYVAIPWAGVPSQDMGAMADWYERVLGERAASSVPPFFVSFRLGDGTEIEVLRGGAPTVRPKTPAEQPFVVGLDVEDLAATVQALLARGVETEMLESDAGAPRRAQVVDPEGNRWLLVESPPAQRDE